MVFGTGVYIDPPTITPAAGGLLAVAEVRESTDPHQLNGVMYLSQACGVATSVPGDNCAMASVVISQDDEDVTVTVSNSPGGLYTFTLDEETPVVAFGPNPVHVFVGVEDGEHTVIVSSSSGDSWTVEFETPLVDPTAPVASVKEATTISVVSGQPFPIYRMVECKDLTDDDTSWATEALALGEAHGVEEGFLRNVLAQPETVNVTSGVTVSLINGIAALEGYAADMYGGIPVLHMPRSVATRALALTALVADGGKVTTKQGSLVANGGGYSANIGPTGTPAAAGFAWLYVTGHVLLTRGPVSAHRVLDVENNNQVALAERTYVPTVDCFKAAVLVALEANDG